MLTLNPTADLFRSVWPRNGAKYAARASGSSLSAAKKWMAARFVPSADTLLRMAAENIELRAELIRRLEAYGYADTNMASSTGLGAAALGRTAGAAGGQGGSTAGDQADAVRLTK